MFPIRLKEIPSIQVNERPPTTRDSFRRRRPRPGSTWQSSRQWPAPAGVGCFGWPQHPRVGTLCLDPTDYPVGITPQPMSNAEGSHTVQVRKSASPSNVARGATPFCSSPGGEEQSDYRGCHFAHQRSTGGNLVVRLAFHGENMAEDLSPERGARQIACHHFLTFS